MNILLLICNRVDEDNHNILVPVSCVCRELRMIVKYKAENSLVILRAKYTNIIEGELNNGKSMWMPSRRKNSRLEFFTFFNIMNKLIDFDVFKRTISSERTRENAPIYLGRICRMLAERPRYIKYITTTSLIWPTVVSELYSLVSIKKRKIHPEAFILLLTRLLKYGHVLDYHIAPAGECSYIASSVVYMPIDSVIMMLQIARSINQYDKHILKRIVSIVRGHPGYKQNMNASVGTTGGSMFDSIESLLSHLSFEDKIYVLC
jgi:hypothetical protein